MNELVTLLALLQRSSAAPPVAPVVAELRVEDLGLAVRWSSPALGGVVLVGVAEDEQGVDANGDGDLLDVVVHAVRIAPGGGGGPVGLGLAARARLDDAEHFTALGLASLWVREADQGASDLNGDGDALDEVRHVVDLATLTTTNLGLVQGSAVARDGGLAVVEAFEPLEGRDLDGDGDALDPLVLLVDLATGAVSVVGPGRPLGLVEGRIVVSDEEWRLGLDLDGDGRLVGERFRLQDPSSGAAVALKIPGSRGGTRALVGSTLFTSPLERELGRDLNGDGDLDDALVHALEVPRMETAGLGLPGSAAGFHPHAGRILGHVSEALAGRDLNGDGDQLDFLLVEYDSARIAFVHHAMDVDGALSGSAPEDLLALLVAEGGVDANGDGDGLDLVPQLYDLATRRRQRLPFAAPLGLGVPPIALAAGRIAFLVGEAEQGEDLNADGDLLDTLLRVHDAATGRVSAPSLAVGPLAGFQGDAWGLWLGARALVFPASEADAGRDLDGDGDLGDAVLHVLALGGATRERPRNLGIGVARHLGFEPRLRERWIGLPLDEVGAGRDLDGDGFVGFVVVPAFHHVASGETFSLGTRGAILAMDEQHALVTLDGVLHRVTLVER